MKTKPNKSSGSAQKEDSPREQFSSELQAASAKQQAVMESLLGSRQIPADVDYSSFVKMDKGLIAPPYSPVKLYTIKEESSILGQCIEAMCTNVDGFGSYLLYKGKTGKENSHAASTEQSNFEEFLKKVNEFESFTTVRMKMREDLETTGNGYFEVIRDRAGSPTLIYHMDCWYVMAQRVQEKPIEITARLFRNGSYRNIKVRRRFRRYAMITNAAKAQIRWFKEYGDPRKMCAITGKYADELEKHETIKEAASEVIHFKLGSRTYGLPRWIGNVLTAMGIRSSDFVNYDLFLNQVVPPLAVMVSGGKLTKESVQDLTNIFLSKKGVTNFNKILILESETTGSLSDKGQSKIELKEMSTARKEDSMFVQYTDKGENRIRGAFRLPPLLLGRSDQYSKSTADSSKMVAEEQIFVPYRSQFDEFANNVLFAPFNLKFWAYASKGPRLVFGSDLINGFEKFSKGAVFSINDGIRLANKVLGTDVAVYQEPWANYPIPIVVSMAEEGKLAFSWAGPGDAEPKGEE